MERSRREFLKTTTVSTLGAMLVPLAGEAAIEPSAASPGFSLQMMATNWGFAGSTDAFCAAAKKEGYDGVEVWWPANNEAVQQDLFEALAKHGLKVGFLCGGYQSDYAAHLQTFVNNLEAATGNRVQKPLYINCHSGRDYFSFAQNKTFIDNTTRVSKATGIPIYHETHRSRMLFAAHIARHFIEQVPELRLTLDISHWCNVHESLLADQPEAVALALERADHIHTRVGHAEGPQVNDPRAPEWDKVVNQHLAWWDAIVERKKKNGEMMTMLTEFGPPDYLPTLPYTRQPLADQWAINVYMMNLLRKRYT